MKTRPTRLAVRGVILQEGRLLLVNAYPGALGGLWCTPGGGVEPGCSLPENLVREIHEETGLTVTVGEPCLINEFHDPFGDFHQVDVYFRCQISGGALARTWLDPEGVVSERRFFARSELLAVRYKPDSLPTVAWSDQKAILYDPLEPIVR